MGALDWSGSGGVWVSPDACLLLGQGAWSVMLRPYHPDERLIASRGATSEPPLRWAASVVALALGEERAQAVRNIANELVL